MCLPLLIGYYTNTFTHLVPGAPEDVTYQILTDTIVQLYWNPPDNPNGNIRSYQVIYRVYRLNQTARNETPHVSRQNAKNTLHDT